MDQHARNRELARRRDAGDPRAEHMLVEENLGLAHQTAHAWVGKSSLEYEELLSEAVIWLYRAARDWKPERATFATYAYQWVRQGVQRAVGEMLPVRLPQHTWEDLTKIRAAERDAGDETLSVDELVERTAIKRTRVELALQGRAAIAGTFPLSELDGRGAWDTPQTSLALGALQHALERLPELERDALALFEGLGETQPHTAIQVAELLSIPSAAEARRLIQRARDLLAEDDELQTYAG